MLLGILRNKLTKFQLNPAAQGGVVLTRLSIIDFYFKVKNNNLLQVGDLNSVENITLFPKGVKNNHLFQRIDLFSLKRVNR